MSEGLGTGELGRVLCGGGRLLAHLQCRSGQSARFDRACRSPTSETSALSRSAQSA